MLGECTQDTVTGPVADCTTRVESEMLVTPRFHHLSIGHDEVPSGSISFPFDLRDTMRREAEAPLLPLSSMISNAPPLGGVLPDAPRGIVGPTRPRGRVRGCWVWA